MTGLPLIFLISSTFFSQIRKVFSSEKKPNRTVKVFPLSRKGESVIKEVNIFMHTFKRKKKVIF